MSDQTTVDRLAEVIYQSQKYTKFDMIDAEDIAKHLVAHGVGFVDGDNWPDNRCPQCGTVCHDFDRTVADAEVSDHHE